MAGTIAPFPKHQLFDNNGLIAAGFKLFSYAAGTTTKQNTFSDSGLASPNTNPIILDSAGRATIFLSPGLSYKFVLAPPTDTDPPTSPLWTVDNVSTVPAGTINIDITSDLAGETLTAGQCVFLSDGSGGLNAGQWYRADNGTNFKSTTAETLGFAMQNITAGQSGTVRVTGQVTGLIGLSAGQIYYVGTLGALTATAPALPRVVGQADSATTLIISQWILPLDASPTVDGTVNFGAQTFGGAKTFNALATFVLGLTSQVTPTFQSGTSGTEQLAFFQVTISPTGIPASVAANTASEVALTGITGLLATDVLVGIQKAGSQAGLYIVPADRIQGGVTGTAAATVKYINVTSGAIVPTAAETYVFSVIRAAPLNTSQLVAVQISAAPTGIPASVASGTYVNDALTGVTGLLSSDILIAVQKNGNQSGLFILPADLTQGGVTGTGACTVRYVNVTTGSLVPTASETYVFTVLRNATLGTQSLTPFYMLNVGPAGAPGSVAAQTTQTATLTVGTMLSADIILGVQRNLGQAGASADTGYTMFANQTQGGGGLASATVTYINQTTGSYTVISSDSYNIIVLRATASVTTSNSGLVSGAIFSQANANGINNVSTGETVAFALQLPPGALSGAGRSCRITMYGGPTAANANTKTVKVYFGGTVFSQALGLNNGNWWIQVLVQFITNTTQQGLSFSTMGTIVQVSTPNPGEDLTRAVTIKGTLTGGASNDIPANGFLLETIGA